MVLHNENDTLIVILNQKDEDLLSTHHYNDDNRKDYYRLRICHEIFAESTDQAVIQDLMKDIVLNLESDGDFTIQKENDKFILKSDKD